MLIFRGVARAVGSKHMEERKKGPWLLRICRGWNPSQFIWGFQYGNYMGVNDRSCIFTGHFEDHPRICKSLVTMVMGCAFKDRVVGPPSKSPFMTYRFGGDPNHLQVLGWSSKMEPKLFFMMHPWNCHDLSACTIKVNRNVGKYPIHGYYITISVNGTKRIWWTNTPMEFFQTC